MLVEVGGVFIEPDLVVGDIDAVVIVPRALEDEVLEAALERASTESEVLRAIEAGIQPGCTAEYLI